MRLVLGCNALWANTGYGTQARSLLPRLRDHGHAVANFAWYGLQGGMMVLDGITVYPVGHDVWGNDIAGPICRHFNADLFLSLMDVWVCAEDLAARVRPSSWAAWAPVDHEPAPPQVIDRWKRSDYPVAYSLSGLQAAKNAGMENVSYIPHGLETGTFRPGDKREAREKLNLPQEAFICAMVAANKGYPARKAFAENLQAFTQFHEKHPEAVLYLHTLRNTAHGGIDLQTLVDTLGISKSVYFVDQFANHLGLPGTYVADVYRAADVLMAASQGEGFGLPIMEAQACGCPVITTNWTAMRELTVNGITTTPAQRVWTPLNSWAATVSVQHVADALEAIYSRPTDEAKAAAELGIITMRQNYDWDMCIERYWMPFLARVERERAEAAAKAAEPVKPEPAAPIEPGPVAPAEAATEPEPERVAETGAV